MKSRDQEVDGTELAMRAEGGQGGSMVNLSVGKTNGYPPGSHVTTKTGSGVMHVMSGTRTPVFQKLHIW